ncbi:PadR family transcriptional regulator [Microbacterium gorillae]|uniref:PadR family transcriptional regulator n=1 Tax=Microbacterium gorillae TaxID=1231063 RepID=UPI00058B9780|nr:PadR family transcriptional regulator [Microbacterium gorillae]
MDPLAIRPLGIMILALLREGDMHPYEMMRLLRERREDRLVTIRNGTFYHQVSALERDGFVAEVGIDRDGNRPERTSYTVTDAGHDAVSAWVRNRLPRIDRPAEFPVAIAEAHNLSATEVIDLLTQRDHTLQARLDEYHEGLAAALDRGVERQYLVEVHRAIALMTADITWSANLRSDLADGSFPWGRPADITRKDDA